MVHTRKIGAHHALMGITMVTFAIGATAFGPDIMRTKAANEGINGKQRDAFVVMCKDKYVDRLTTALKEATSQPGVRRALEGYWKEMNACILYSIQKARTASGSDMGGKREEEMKRKQGSGTMLTEEQRKKMEGQDKPQLKPQEKPNTKNTAPDATVRPSGSPSAGANGEKKPEFRNTAPKPGESPRPLPTHNGRDEI